MTFWEIAGARIVVFYEAKSSPRWDREGPRSGGCVDDDFIVGSGRISSDLVGLSSNRLSIGGSTSRSFR